MLHLGKRHDVVPPSLAAMIPGPEQISITGTVADPAQPGHAGEIEL